ncbi:MAG: 2-hydroxychromene-2-carboxylate isomerase [Rhodospirillales bacterium]|nr:2-hydroxychromene-2-carboxylate isomerase [Rhodospirillales bacterium]
MQFWFEFASTYSYPAAMRIEAAAARHGVALDWRPFWLGPIFAEQGWNDSPFNLQPAKGRYMWRDLERRCAGYGLPLLRPSRFPRNGRLAARIVIGAAGEPWLPAFVRAVYHANFAEDRNITDRGVIVDLLEGLGLPSAALLASGESERAKEALAAQTAQAQRLGVFGAPSFIVGDELFWGDDRLEDALDWHVRHAA